MFDFTEPMAQYWRRSVWRRYASRERGDLDGVTERRARAVRLDHADGVGVHVGDGEGVLDDGALTVQARGREADLGGTVVVDGRPPDDGVDRVARPSSASESRFSATKADAAGHHRPSRVGVEGAHVPVGGQDAVLLVDVAAA